MHLEEEKCIQHLGWKPEGKGHIENLGPEGTVLKCILHIWDGSKNRINLAQDTNRKSLVNMAMNFPLPQNAGNFLTEQILVSQEWVCYME
jgi:hypothetical protein